MYSQTTVVGHVGRDSEMRFTTSGTAVTSFSVAVSKQWTGKDGQRQEQTTWYKVSAWQKLAEVCGEYVKKGMQIMVVGEMQDSNVWTDNEGNARCNLELTARTVKFLGSKGDTQPAAPKPAIDPNVGPDRLDESIPF